MDETTKDIAIQSGANLAVLVGLIGNGIGVVDPIAGAAAAGFSQCAAGVLSHLTSKRSQRQQRNLDHILKYLDRRINDDTQGKVPDEQIDLFAHLLQNAVDENDVAKLPVHAEFIAWVMFEKRDPALIRLVGTAVKDLLTEEIRAIATWHHQGGGNALIKILPQPVFWNRMSSYGITSGGSVIHSSNITPVGIALANIAKDLQYTEGERRSFR